MIICILNRDMTEMIKQSAERKEQVIEGAANNRGKKKRENEKHKQ